MCIPMYLQTCIHTHIHLCIHKYMYIQVQHTATRCNTLQHTATHSSSTYVVSSQVIAAVVVILAALSWEPCLHTLQHAATHCNALQQTHSMCPSPLSGNRGSWSGARSDVRGSPVGHAGFSNTLIPHSHDDCSDYLLLQCVALHRSSCL